MQGLFFNRKSPVFNIDLKKRRSDTDGGIPMKKLEEYVLSIPDFPEEGIIFRDVTSVLQDAEGFHLAIDKMQELIADLDYDVVV